MGLTLPRYAAFRRGFFAYPRPEHRSGRDDRRRGRERASFGRLGRHGRERKAHPRLPLRPNSRARRGAWAGTKEPRPLGDWGTGVFITGWVRFVGIGVQRHPAPNQRPQAAKAFRLLPYASRKAASACSLGYASACGDTQGSGQGGAGVQPTCLCASFNQRHDAERAPRQRQAPRQRPARQRQSARRLR